jgi:hypothetical protein
MPLANGTEPEQTILRLIRDEVLARSQEAGGPQFSIWTGDAYDTPGNTGLETVEQNSKLGETIGVCLTTGVVGVGAACLRPGAQKYRRFNEQLTDYLRPRGLPLFAAIGARDLSETRACVNPTVGVASPPVCAENRDRPRIGENIAWRQAMEDQPGPWGAADPAATSSPLSRWRPAD